MKITVEVELNESEANYAHHVSHQLQTLSDRVITRIVTDKPALARMLLDLLSNKNTLGSGLSPQADAEILRRLSQPALQEDCVDVLCDVIFSEARTARGESVLPFVGIVSRLPEPHCSQLRDELIVRWSKEVSKPRRLDAAREPILPYAEGLAGLVKYDLLSCRTAILTLCHMLRMEQTRCAAVTCLGKLVELACELIVERCEPSVLEELRSTLGLSQADCFLYDIEYISEPLGWSQSRPTRFLNVQLVRPNAHHDSPILSLVYAGGSREVVVTSSADGTFATWDGSGTLVENVVLARHYACALDIAGRGRALLVAGVGREPSVTAAVVIYVEEGGRWEERGAVEPPGARVISAIRGVRTTNMMQFCAGLLVGESVSMGHFDASRCSLIREYNDHTDLITALHSPERENTMVSGSRDTSLLLYDLRTHQVSSQLGCHYSTVSSITMAENYVISGGLDKRLLAHDLRVPGQQLVVRDMDTPILSVAATTGIHGNVCAVATLTGLYMVHLANAAAMFKVDGSPAAPRYNALAWNSHATALYAGGDSNTLDYFMVSA